MLFGINTNNKYLSIQFSKKACTERFGLIFAKYHTFEDI